MFLVVVFTGVGDMRVEDNSALWSVKETWTPVFAVPRCSAVQLRALKAAALDLDAELFERYGARLSVAPAAEVQGETHSDYGLREPYEGSDNFDDYVAWARTKKRTEPKPPPKVLPKAEPFKINDWSLLDGHGDEPYLDAALKFCGCKSALRGIDEYLTLGRDAFAAKYFKDVGGESLYAAAAAWVAASEPEKRMALREPAERAFGAALATGAVSARSVAKLASRKAGFPTSKLGSLRRNAAGALLDVVEWREWYDILKARSKDEWWAWGAAKYPIRYVSNGKKSKNALLLIHGFGASADQWTRLAQYFDDVAVYAVDIVGFGYSAKPGLTYTQHLWEAMLEDFTREVVLKHHETVTLVGNSIGGGLSAGLAANLGDTCSGLVLCNTAGNIVEEMGPRVKDLTLNVLNGEGPKLDDFKPPFGGQLLLDAFGQAVIEILKPQIPSLLKKYYPTNPDNADDDLANAIARDACDPGAANVIASGAKLPPQRPLNEVLTDFQGPILVPQGEFDYVSGPDRTRQRAVQLANLRPGVTVSLLASGHCPHDETPDLVAAAIRAWLPATQNK